MLNATTQTAKDKGRQHATLKVSGKKKRSKEQIDEVREQELQLKSNKHAFLLEVKQLQNSVNNTVVS